MKLQLKKYIEQLKVWPEEGQHIMAQYSADHIVVYQSYRPEIGNFAVKNQYFGGAFSLERMTWIKPNFLWMMYRNGWGQKVGQEVVLAIHLKMSAFVKYLEQAEYSTFKSDKYESREEWKASVKSSSVRLQWDPDHDPFGEKVARRAIQIGIRNEMIESYSRGDILLIEDVSFFVFEQYNHVKSNNLDKLLVPEEKPLLLKDENLAKRLNIAL